MKVKNILLGIILIVLGLGLYVYYDFHIKPEKEAGELINEGVLVCERGDKDSINSAINLFTKVLAKYPISSKAPVAYYHIGLCYEKLNLHRLAYLKYIYLLKNNPKIDNQLKREVLVRLAHIKVMKQYSEEAINQLYTLLNTNFNREFRSRVYSELGHTYLKQSEYKSAKKMFDVALNEYGDNEEALIGKARSYKRLGYDNDAYDLYEYFLKYYGAISQYTSDVKKAYKEQAYYSGLSAFRSANYQSAISFFNRILRNFPYEKISENAMYWIGESYFAMKDYDRAIDCFNKVLYNNYYNKDEDARIKKGYAYFNSKRFDLAAREFQNYLKQYPHGKYTIIANNWNEMSSKELMLRMKAKQVPENDEELELELNDKTKKDNEKQTEEELDEENDEEVSGALYNDVDTSGIELENVAEL